MVGTLNSLFKKLVNMLQSNRIQTKACLLQINGITERLYLHFNFFQAQFISSLLFKKCRFFMFIFYEEVFFKICHYLRTVPFQHRVSIVLPSSGYKCKQSHQSKHINNNSWKVICSVKIYIVRVILMMSQIGTFRMPESCSGKSRKYPFSCSAGARLLRPTTKQIWLNFPPVVLLGFLPAVKNCVNTASV